uniref:Uncharacterized protein n=1 Tax=Setaria digitata TaxID=48799 RepID=A0A915PYJ7_9BILA
MKNDYLLSAVIWWKRHSWPLGKLGGWVASIERPEYAAASWCGSLVPDPYNQESPQFMSTPVLLFSGYSHLHRTRDLQENKISEIRKNDLSALRHLKILQLMDNHIHTIESDAFDNLIELERLLTTFPVSYPMDSNFTGD